MDQLEAIVRALAVSDPIEWSDDEDSHTWCALCKWGSDHAETCPWRMAKEWVSQQADDKGE